MVAATFACENESRKYGAAGSGGAAQGGDAAVSPGGVGAAGGSGGRAGADATASGGGSAGGSDAGSHPGVAACEGKDDGEVVCDGLARVVCGGAEASAPEPCKAGVETCASGTCTACAALQANCDDDARDCETDLTSTRSGGTSCETAVACNEANATGASCTGGRCRFTCRPGYADCDGDGSNGCETNLDSAETCGATCATAMACSWPTPACRSGACAPPPSCVGLPNTCGPQGNASCCDSPLVTGGTFSISNETQAHATVSDFRLDRYEITVGRFKKFVADWGAGYRPS